MELINRILYNLVEVHPLHPLIVHFPIALSSAALFFMLLALWRRSDELEKVAFANMGLSAISTLVAGITGWLDNNTTYDGGAPNALAKIVLASVLLAVSVVVTIIRWRKPGLFHSRGRSFYVGSYFVCFALVSVLGFLGGIILYGFEEIPPNTQTGSGSGQAVTVQEPAFTPTAAPDTDVSGISFSNEILPIFKSRCINCHGGQKIEEGLDLTSYAAVMAGSENGLIVLPGDLENSLLAQALIEREMPKRGPKLSPDQAQLILDWISQGAPDN
jgi:uncharacterized membrane protein